jgi:hypothetical protein
MSIGTYPFRCLDCNERFSANVFLLSSLGFAKCPKCLSMDIAYPSRKGRRSSLRRKLLLVLGARRCRCVNCRYMFVSFRPLAETHRAVEPLESPDGDVTANPQAKAQTSTN